MNYEKEISRLKSQIKHNEDMLMAQSAKIRGISASHKEQYGFLAESLVKFKSWVEHELGHDRILEWEQQLANDVVVSIEKILNEEDTYESN